MIDQIDSLLELIRERLSFVGNKERGVYTAAAAVEGKNTVTVCFKETLRKGKRGGAVIAHSEAGMGENDGQFGAGKCSKGGLCSTSLT